MIYHLLSCLYIVFYMVFNCFAIIIWVGYVNLEVDVIKNNWILKCLLMMVISMFCVHEEPLLQHSYKALPQSGYHYRWHSKPCKLKSLQLCGRKSCKLRWPVRIISVRTYLESGTQCLRLTGYDTGSWQLLWLRQRGSLSCVRQTGVCIL